MLQILAVLPTAKLVRRISKPLADEEVVSVRTLAQAEDHLREHHVDVVLAMHTLSDGHGTELLDGLANEPSFPLVVLAEAGNERDAVTAMRAGAMDFVVLSPRSVAAMPHILRGAKREFQLVQRARVAEDSLRHANRLIGTGRLAAITAHEVGTPLNVVRMAAQLVASDPANAERHSALIIEQVDLVATRLRNMLDYSRASSAGPQPMALGPAVVEAVELLRPLAVRQGVEVTVEPQEHVVRADRQQIRQVVFNLLTNGLQALRKHGSIRIELPIEERNRIPYAVIAVIDDGPGVPTDVAKHLFEAFFTTKPAGKGTGLGLAVCHQIATAHDGWLECESVPGRTRFALGLPLLKQSR